MKSKKNSRITKREARKKSRKKKLLMFILIPILLLVTATSVYAFNIWSQTQQAMENTYEDLDRERSDLRDFDVNPDHNHISILFIGVDESSERGNNDSGLSDALILTTLNKEDNSIKMLSIPRDSYVYIPEVGYYDKINHAHSFGGPTATIDAVEGFLDIPVDYYSRLDFNAFIDVVDELNGITYDVPFELWEMDSEDNPNAIHLEAGEQRIYGEEALALARTRRYDNDLERGKRQQELMEAIFDRIVSFSSINRIGNVINAVEDNITHNFRNSDIMSLVDYGISGDLDIETLNLEGSDLRQDGIYYFQLDEDHLFDVQNKLKIHLGLLNENEVDDGLDNEERIGDESDFTETNTEVDQY